MHSFAGQFSAQVQQLVESLIRLRIYVEAAIDFPEEGDRPLSGWQGGR